MNYFLLEKYSYCRVEQFAKLGIISQRAAVNQRMQFWMNKLFVLRKKIYTHCCSLLIAYASRLVGWGGGLYLFIFCFLVILLLGISSLAIALETDDLCGC